MQNNHRFRTLGTLLTVNKGIMYYKHKPKDGLKYISNIDHQYQDL